MISESFVRGYMEKKAQLANGRNMQKQAMDPTTMNALLGGGAGALLGGGLGYALSDKDTATRNALLGALGGGALGAGAGWGLSGQAKHVPVKKFVSPRKLEREDEEIERDININFIPFHNKKVRELAGTSNPIDDDIEEKILDQHYQAVKRLVNPGKISSEDEYYGLGSSEDEELFRKNPLIDVDTKKSLLAKKMENDRFAQQALIRGMALRGLKERGFPVTKETLKMAIDSFKQ